MIRAAAARALPSRMTDPASLGARLVLIMTAVGLAGAIAITLMLAAIITPSFTKLEQRAVANDVERTRAVLTDYGAKVESAVRDYGDWTQSYDYMARPTVAFERESFSPLAMSNLGVQGMAYVAADRRIVIARWIDPATQAEQPAMRARLVAAIAAIDLDRALAGRSSMHFYARLGRQVAAIAIAQVRRSDGTGTPRGHVLMARAITSDQLSKLLQIAAAIDLADRTGGETVTSAWSTMTIRVPIPGVDGRGIASARFTVPREVSVLGRRMLLLAVAGSTLLLLMVLVVLRRMIDRLVLAPLGRVEHQMQRVRASGSLALLDEDRRRDEIGSLGRSFNAMLVQLRALHEQIEVQSFALGRSESTVAVMHNVRNALNPVTTILSKGVAQAPPVDRSTLDRAIAELAEDTMASARRHKLTAFVEAAIETERAAREAMRSELQVAREAMAHALEIIGQQQQRAHERPTLEACDVTELIARNATIARYSQKVSIALAFPATPHRAMASRVILSQVIGNVLGNAAEAIAATGRRDGRIAVTIDEEGDRVVVRISDDGEGFDATAGEALFQRGYSTRAHKSGGLGLHWCANSMTAMEGSLALESEGRGRGATAVLTLKALALPAMAEAA